MVAVALAGVLVGVAGVGVPAALVETGSATFVGFGCPCGGSIAFGGCVAVGTGAEVGSGVGVGVGVCVEVGVGVQNPRIGKHAELAAWLTPVLEMPLSEKSKSV